MSKRGRPKLEDSKKRDTFASTRMTAEEHVMLEKFAWAEGISTSTAIRWLITGCLSDSEVRRAAMKAGDRWLDSSASYRAQVVGNCAGQFKQESIDRMQEQLRDEAHATVSDLEYFYRQQKGRGL